MSGHVVAHVDDLTVGAGHTVVAGDRQIALFRLRSGRVRAVAAVCPHRGGPIADGQADDSVVLCPLHLTAFDLTTGCAADNSYALDVFPVEVRADGAVVVTVDSQPATTSRSSR